MIQSPRELAPWGTPRRFNLQTDSPPKIHPSGIARKIGDNSLAAISGKGPIDDAIAERRSYRSSGH
ncbi:MAG: hypothetical protein ABSH08_00120, partial [Tepidisphaeraceae bacterium]